jgi:gamma-glutamyltranspeptidase/glutathione hydrolase
MLQKGGNAVDAALATAITLAVVEPTSNGIGSDVFAIVWDGKKLHGLNASGRAPAAWTPGRFSALTRMPLTGWDSVSVPGAVSAWIALSERFGILPFEELIKPAVYYAREGFNVAPGTAIKWRSRAHILKEQPGFADAYMPAGRVPEPGEKFSFPDQAGTLEKIASTRGEDFYRGELAQTMIADCSKYGGAMTLEDLASHKADWIETISQAYNGHEIHELPPNGQGIAVLMALGILTHHKLADVPVDSADSLHLQIEAMKLAVADVHRYVADPAAMDRDVGEFLDADYLAQRAALIDMKSAQDFGHGVPLKGGTAYLTAADAKGMMVSYIQSNSNGFGSGVIVPGTGISLHNRGGRSFTLESKHPNQVGSGKKPFHTIIPAFVTKDGAPLISFGSAGGSMQPQGQTQIMVRIIDYRQNPQAALDAPRWRVIDGLTVVVEQGYSREALDGLKVRGHDLVEIGKGHFNENVGEQKSAARKVPSNFGSAQLIYRLTDSYVAASDHRRDGQPVGF